MSNVLYVEASPREHRSFSSRVAGAFFDECRAHHPAAVIDHLKLFEHPVPEFDREAADQKMQQIVARMSGRGNIGRLRKPREIGVFLVLSPVPRSPSTAVIRSPETYCIRHP